MKRSPLRYRSKKAKDRDADRAACRAEVIERDLGDPELGMRLCVFHRILTANGASRECGSRMAEPPEVHEIITRGRGGSTTDPSNCVALCHAAHTWVTAHPAGAEALGLMLPSWATPGHELIAAAIRETWSVGFPSIVPSWRRGTPYFETNALRDLHSIGLIQHGPEDRP